MKKLFAIVLVLFICVGSAAASTIGDTIEVSLASESGRLLPFYPRHGSPNLKKAYTEAVRGNHYRIVIRNKLNRRVGVVVAVDGRNIISGQKSWLRNQERMYVLDPYATGEYSGWRTAQDKINRFYFTSVPDSYAAAFGDQSAMGVIAVAVYPEIQHFEPPLIHSHPMPEVRDRFEAKGKSAAPSVQSRVQESAGTGYGREEYSPSYRVSFDPENQAAETVLIKYEWHQTLCKMKIISCCRVDQHSHNRIWDNDGYAPPPPCRR